MDNIKDNHPINMPLNLNSLKANFTLKILIALNKINRNQPKESNDYNNNNHLILTKRCKKVKVASDVCLASAVGPSRAWARTIMGRARFGYRRRILRRKGVLRGRKRCGRAMMGRAEELRKVVPGGEEIEDVQSLLDETLDYIMCLNMQINVMRSIVHVCSNS